jgi:hypothetical protein
MSTLTDWVRKAGVTLPPPYAWVEEPTSSLDPFAPALEGKQAVFLGEMDHFIHEKADFRLLLCRWLIGQGFTRLAEELSWSDGTRVDRYLKGEIGQIERLTSLGYEGDLRGDRSDRPTGILKASFDAYPVDLFGAEQRRFYQGLSRIGAPVDYFGLDIDALPGGAYADIADAVADLPPDPAREAWLAGLERVAGETVAEEAVRARKVLTGYREGVFHLPTLQSRQRVGVGLVNLVQSLEYVAETYPQTTYEGLAKGLAMREDAMKDRAYIALEHLGQPGKTVFMGHALHLLKDDTLAESASASGPGGGQATTLGHHIATTWATPTFSVWMIFGAGEDSQPFQDLPRRFDYPRDTLNAQLSSVLRPVMFPVAGAPPGLFDRPWRVGHMYNQTAAVTLTGQVDAILYVPRVSPMNGG